VQDADQAGVKRSCNGTRRYIDQRLGHSAKDLSSHHRPSCSNLLVDRRDQTMCQIANPHGRLHTPQLEQAYLAFSPEVVSAAPVPRRSAGEIGHDQRTAILRTSLFSAWT
jgi:hypothetical protein